MKFLRSIAKSRRLRMIRGQRLFVAFVGRLLSNAVATVLSATVLYSLGAPHISVVALWSLVGVSPSLLFGSWDLYKHYRGETRMQEQIDSLKDSNYVHGNDIAEIRQKLLELEDGEKPAKGQN